MNDDKLSRQLEREGAEALLDIGITIPLLRFRLPFRSTPVEIRKTMRRPTLGALIRLAHCWLQMDTTADQLWEMTKDEQFQFLDRHGKHVSRMIAICICRSFPFRRTRTALMAWLVRSCMPVEYQLEAVKRFVALLGTDPFLPIITSAERMNPLKPRVSQPTPRS